MNKTLGLMVAHGSPFTVAIEQTQEMHRQLASRCAVPLDLSYLEFAEPDLDEGLRRAARSAGEDGRVVVLPLFLGAAKHFKRDIPASLDRSRRSFPGVEFRCAAPLAPHANLVALLDLRIREALAEARTSIPDEESVVLVAGRGSSDADSNSEIARTARLLFEGHPYAGVEYAYQAVARPSIPEGIARAARLGARQVVVALDILFRGFVEEDILAKARQKGQELGLSVVTSAPLGIHALILAVLEQRLNEALTGNVRLACDTCKYRAAADGGDFLQAEAP